MKALIENIHINPQLLFLLATLLIAYLLILKPKQKETQNRKNFLTTLKEGTQVTTIGGIHGKIVQTNKNTATLEIDRKGSQITIAKESIISLPNTNK